MKRLRTLPAIAGLSACFLVGGVGVAAAVTSVTTPLPEVRTEAVVAAASDSVAPPVLPSPRQAVAPDQSAPAAAPVPRPDPELVDANAQVAAAEGGTGARAEELAAPPSTPVGPGPLTNAKSKPMDMTYVPDAPVEEAPTAVILPEGILYQRVAPGSAPMAFQPVTDLPTNADVVAIIHAVFPESEWRRAELVAGCESGMKSTSSKPNRNGSRDHGVFQLNDGGTLQGLMRSMNEPVTDMNTSINKALDPQWNVRAAHVLWQQRGWQPWTCSAKTGVTDGLYSSRPGPNG